MALIDLRSDTVTRPSAGMRAAMASAEVGDDVFGEDPTVNSLEARVAALLGKEAALFVPSGTMANQLSLGTLLSPGDELLVEAGSHCIVFEGGGLAAFWGAQPLALFGERGLLSAAQLVARPAGNDHLPRTRALAVENTHNRGGGSVWPLERLRAVTARARELGLFVHLDGARLFNASVASGVAPKDFAACADTVSVCLSKGLGAPVGSLLASTAERVRAARRLRKRFGGGMRQAGILAAAGHYALDHNVERLAVDHANARRLAAALNASPGMSAPPPETNLVFVDLAPALDVARFVAAARENGVLCGGEGAPGRVRLVTHLDVDERAMDVAAAALARAAGAAAR